nr:integrase, catalytic region, zinc finger, CCHC-type, peptidase aspartic, catalytic [Tanacetum cinerariifolium]
MQKSKVAKFAKQKVTSEWKPIVRIFKTVGLKWVPTGRMFTLIESKCSSSPSQNTTTKILPNRQIPKTTAVPDNELCTQIRRRYENVRKYLYRPRINSQFHPFNINDLDYRNCSLVPSTSLLNKFLRTKDEALKIIIKVLKQAQVSLNTTIRYLCTDNGTEFLNQTLGNYTEEVGFTYMTSTSYTPKQNGVVERRNRMLVEAVRTILIFFKSPLFLWAEAVASAWYTQNSSFIHTRYDKTPYELLRDRKLELKYLYVFGALCYLTNDFQDIRKLQPKADIGIFIGYSPSKKAYQIYNKRTRKIMETINDLVFQPMFDEYFKNPSAASNPISVVTLPLPKTARASSSSSTSIDNDAQYPNADHASCQDLRKSTSGSAQFLGEKLSAIALSCNTVQHSKTKHIAIRYHFIKEQVENEVVELYFVKNDYQLAEIFTKALARERFGFLINRLGMQSLTPKQLKRLA